VYALNIQLGCSTIYVINRVSEVEAVLDEAERLETPLLRAYIAPYAILMTGLCHDCWQQAGSKLNLGSLHSEEFYDKVSTDGCKEEAGDRKSDGGYVGQVCTPTSNQA